MPATCLLTNAGMLARNAHAETHIHRDFEQTAQLGELLHVQQPAELHSTYQHQPDGLPGLSATTTAANTPSSTHSFASSLATIESTVSANDAAAVSNDSVLFVQLAE